MLTGASGDGNSPLITLVSSPMPGAGFLQSKYYTQWRVADFRTQREHYFRIYVKR
ncbi:MAG: hypothetical protein IPI77_23500 [Saprospiraceae bacterium]|nr:hypothetical protein [Saprospiraceae bacterium]